MSETILRFSLGELDTIRIKIGDVVSEMPLNGNVVAKFAADQVGNRYISEPDKQRLVKLIVDLVEAKDMLSLIGIEFVLPSKEH